MSLTIARRHLQDVTIKIVHGTRDNGYAYTNLLHSWIENGQRRHASSRMDGFYADTPHNRAFQLEAFKRRNQTAVS
jgi:hypothetical protein